MKEKFSDIIEKGEEIIKVYKPNKKKFTWVVILSCLGMMILPVVFIILCFVLPADEVAADAEENVAKLVFFIASCAVGLIVLIGILLCVLYYKNKYYAYTTKRVIVRSGIFGIDYASLEFKSLTATVVSVSLLDKILGNKTGSIKFGSASSQISGGVYQASMMNPYIFRHIEKPYEVMREIKEYINEHQ
jgi:fumarate reductase subunit D